MTNDDLVNDSLDDLTSEEVRALNRAKRKQALERRPQGVVSAVLAHPVARLMIAVPPLVSGIGFAIDANLDLGGHRGTLAWNFQRGGLWMFLLPIVLAFVLLRVAWFRGVPINRGVKTAMLGAACAAVWAMLGIVYGEHLGWWGCYKGVMAAVYLIPAEFVLGLFTLHVFLRVLAHAPDQPTA